MKKEELFKLLGQVDPEYIADARPPMVGRPARRWIHWALPAACLALVAGTLLPGTWPPGLGSGAASSAPPFSSSVLPSGSVGPSASSGGSQGAASSPAGSVQPGISSSVQIAPAGSQADPSLNPGDLPLLNIPNDFAGAMGYEGMTLPEGEPLVLSSPWQEEQKIETLPVYANGSYLNEAGTPWGMTEEEMKQILADTARALGAKVLEVTGESNGLTDSGEPLDAVTGIIAQTDQGQIRVDASGNIRIDFDGGLALPKGYALTAGPKAEKALKWLTERFSGLLNYVQPEYDGTQEDPVWGYVVYDADGDEGWDIQNRFLRYAWFCPDEAGRLDSIRIYDWLDCAVKLGDYPLIPPERARALLRNGNYVTSAPWPLAGEDYVAGVELVYRASEAEQTLLPWYRFWAELPMEEKEDGSKTYGAYYVPAVEPGYITRLPLYKGHFN